MLNFLCRAAEGKVKLPPTLVEKLVKKLKVEAVTTELINIGIDLPKNAAKRKFALERYLTSEFTTLNMIDYNESCELERSRLGTNKNYLRGFKKSHKAKASKNKSKARKSKSMSNKPHDKKSKNTVETGDAPVENDTKNGTNETESERTGVNRYPIDKLMEESDNEDKRKGTAEKLNKNRKEHFKVAKELKQANTGEKSNQDPGNMVNNGSVATERKTETSESEKTHLKNKKKVTAEVTNKNTQIGEKAKRNPDNRFEKETAAKPEMRDASENARPSTENTCALKSVNDQEPTAVKKKQNRKKTAFKDPDTDKVLHLPTSDNKDNNPRDFEKPLKTLEASLIKLQDNLNAQGEQITLLSAKGSTPDRVSAKTKQQHNYDTDLLDLRCKVDTLLKTIEVQQETLLQLTDKMEGQKQGCSALLSKNNPRTCPDCQQCKVEILELKATVSSLLNEFTTLKRNAEKPCPCAEKVLRTMVYEEHSYCKFPKTTQKESERHFQAKTEINFRNVVNCQEIEVGQHVTLESSPSPNSVLHENMGNRGKCIVVQDGKLTSADKKNLGTNYEMEYFQVFSINKALDSIQSIQERIQKTAPKVVFLNLGTSEVRNDTNSALQFPNKIYKRFIAKCAEPLQTGSKIVIALLPLTKKNRLLNDRITQFNKEIAKMSSNLKLDVKYGTLLQPNNNKNLSNESSNSWTPLNERNVTLVKENSLDMQPIPVLRGDMTRSTVPTNTSARQGSPPNRVHKINQGDSDARKSHSQEAKPGNSISAAPVQGPTVPYPHMSINQAISTTEGRDTKRSHIHPRGRTYSTSSAYHTRPTGFKNVPGNNPERNSEANISKIPTGARKSDNFGTERKSSTVGNETKRKCLLVHDDFLAAFDDTKFTSAVTVECFKVKSTSQLIHTGGLIAKVDLDKNIGRTNKEVADFVTFLRTKAAYKDRIFCSSNNRVGGYVTRKVGTHGIDLFVGDREVTLENIPILSWNIHDSITSKEGPKIDDDDFVAILSRSTIFCLQETKQEFFLPNYECFNSNRNDSRSGGVCIGVHRSLSKHTKIRKTECPDFQAITVYPYDSDKKFTIINVYDSPEQSSYKAKRRANEGKEDSLSTLDQLLEFRAKNTDLGDVMMVGDLNARTGSLNIGPVAEEDLEYAIPESHPETSERVSKDQIINSRGSKLIDFLACTKLSIMNGQTLGDIFGEFTSINYNGASVVDYMAASPELLESVMSFEVLDLTKFSDHKPCLCKLRRSYSYVNAQVLLDKLEDAPKKFKWDNEDEGLRQRFLAAQNTPDLKRRIERISGTHCKDSKEVLDLNEELVSVYQELANEVLPKRKPASKNKKTQAKRRAIKPKAPWFDSHCINGKRDLNRLAKSYGKSPTNLNLRTEYYDKRREYRRLIKHKKANFIKTLYEDIESGKNVNWKRFKNIKNMKANGNKLDVFDMMNFSRFFKDLYGKPTISQQKIAQLQEEISKEIQQRKLSETLDCDITPEELEGCIRALKSGKAVSEDLISNEWASLRLIQQSGEIQVDTHSRSSYYHRRSATCKDWKEWTN
ncbi:hypothetical protein ACHWQZ_G016865 [Mnemiopsis leidyi]